MILQAFLLYLSTLTLLYLLRYSCGIFNYFIP